MKSFTMFALKALLEKEKARAKAPPAPPPVVVNVDLEPIARLLASKPTVKVDQGTTIVPG